MSHEKLHAVGLGIQGGQVPWLHQVAVQREAKRFGLEHGVEREWVTLWGTRWLQNSEFMAG